MSKILTPDEIIQELRRLLDAASKAPQAIYESECRLADAEYEYERVYAMEYLKHQGTVADRQALAKLGANEARLAADLAKAELNRVRNKAKQISDAGMLVATMSKNVELTYRHA